jgi:hypothetical protein
MHAFYHSRPCPSIDETLKDGFDHNRLGKRLRAALISRHSQQPASLFLCNVTNVRTSYNLMPRSLFQLEPRYRTSDRHHEVERCVWGTQNSDPLDEEPRRSGTEMIAPHRTNRRKPPTRGRRRLKVLLILLHATTGAKP